MACLITRPDPQTLFNQYRDRFSADVLGGAPVVPESNEWYTTALNYAMAEEFYAISEQQWRERDPRYACCDNLFDMAARDGVHPHPARSAQGYVIVSGTPGSLLPATFEMTAENGQTYVSASALPSQMPTAGSFVARVQAIIPGLAGNAAGNVATGNLTTPIAGVNTLVTVCGGSFCGGQAPEECETFRQRYIARKQYQPRATQAWAQQTMMEWPCVTRVMPRGGNCCTCGDDTSYSCTSCGTGLDFYVMMDNSFPCGVPPANILEEIQTWFFGANQGRGQGQAEIGVCGSIVRPTPFDVDVYVDIVSCPSASQMTRIEQLIQDFFRTISPSVDLLGKQIESLVSTVMGPLVDVSARYVVVNQADVGLRASPDDCGGLLVTCDSLPCMRTLNVTGPGIASGGNC